MAREGEADPFDLARFVRAQEGTFQNACAELRAGGKRSHFMWFVFPQHVALGRSERARHFGIAGRDEARAYRRHALLGPRLVEAAQAALHSGVRDPRTLFGAPDDRKLRSSLTLFLVAAGEDAVLREALETFFAGEPDPKTIALLLNDDAPAR